MSGDGLDVIAEFRRVVGYSHQDSPPGCLSCRLISEIERLRKVIKDARLIVDTELDLYSEERGDLLEILKP